MPAFLDKETNFEYHLGAPNMRREKIFLAIVALIIGIFIAIVAFYFYESARSVKPNKLEKLNILSPTPSNNSVFLILNSPLDQSVSDNRIITVSGKTVTGAKIVVLTQTKEVAAISSTDGSFSTTITLDNGVNILEVDAISSDGQMNKVRRTVTYTTQNF